MRRRSFLKNSVLSAAGMGMSKTGIGYQTLPKELSYPGNRKILAWSHSYLDFQGDEASVKREFERAADSGIDLLLLFVHSVPQENNAWYNATQTGFVVEDRYTRLQRVSADTGLEIHPIVLGISDIGLPKVVRAERSYASGAPGGNKRDGVLCASWEATRAGTLRIASDIISQHRPKGVQIDFLRYWDTGIGLEWPCTCSACRSGYKEFVGREKLTAEDLKNPGVLYKYLQFRNFIIFGHLKSLRRLAKQNALEFSIAARADYFGNALVEGQDWIGWGKQHLVDFICPMNYRKDRNEHREILSLQLQALDGAVPVYSGIGRKWSGGEITAAEMIRQAEDAFRVGATGICIFNFNALREDDFRALKAFRRQLG